MGKWLDEEVWLPRWAWVGIMVIWFAIGGYVGVCVGFPPPAKAPPPLPKPVRIVRIGVDLVSAEDMARAAGWEGDWREYSTLVERANGWERWPVVHAGDEVVLP